LIKKETHENDGKVLICGNGVSASDSEHIVVELMKGFILMSISYEH
jgi:D-sedoheptulose 7-phosphate isomerase